MAFLTLAINLPHPDDTDLLGARLADAMASETALIKSHGLTLHLEGDLGAGKTSLTRALLRRLGHTGPVKSPTFSLVESYPVLGVMLNHFDFYRFEEPEEFEDAGFRDLFGPGFITATEWTEKAAPYVPDADLRIQLSHVGLGRAAQLEALTEEGHQVLSHLRKEYAPHA